VKSARPGLIAIPTINSFQRSEPLSLELLFERPDLPRFELPSALVHQYGGGLGFDSPCLFANFVASVDGVVALPGDAESGHLISQNNEADRFVMGLLRACADAVVLGAGTFRKSPGHLWHADAIYPAGATLFAETRKRLGLRARPTLVLVTGSGVIDTAQPAIHDALIVTTVAGEATLRAHAPPTARIAVLGSNRIRFADLLALLQQEGSRIVLTEGGPSLLGELVADGLLDELFLTSSPTLFGRYPSDQRKTLTDGVDLAGVSLELLSARRHGSHLFFRYSLHR
jgi:riboflavin biosynthesis pyrimidine reductase